MFWVSRVPYTVQLPTLVLVRTHNAEPANETRREGGGRLAGAIRLREGGTLGKRLLSSHDKDLWRGLGFRGVAGFVGRGWAGEERGGAGGLTAGPQERIMTDTVPGRRPGEGELTDSRDRESFP
jgi:hypothetical protein